MKVPCQEEISLPGLSNFIFDFWGETLGVTGYSVPSVTPASTSPTPKVGAPSGALLVDVGPLCLLRRLGHATVCPASRKYRFQM